jgi:hypothetical protein
MRRAGKPTETPSFAPLARCGLKQAVLKNSWRNVVIDDGIKRRLLDRCEEHQGRYADTPCWCWTGQKDLGGYGRITYRGQTRGVHRLAYEYWIGPIPEGMQVNHICNIRECFRPEHLKLGTQRSNVDDMLRDGRGSDGVANGRSRLFLKDVIEILRLSTDGRSDTWIARKFGVSQWLIWKVTHGRTYRDIPGPRREAIKPTNRFYGVSKYGAGRWQARLPLGRRKEKYLGLFGHELLAACCVNAHFAWLNLDKPLNVIDPDEWKQVGIYD